jgi:glycosyltransferase involved in cell wall biosynthesis
MNKKRDNLFLNRDLDYNPYFPQDEDFFDIAKAELKVDYQRYRNKPEFSVVIPTFNKKGSLRFVLASVFNQNYPKPKYEIIAVDDGSRDGTSELIEKIKPNCNFKYIYWPRKNIKPKKEYKKWAKFYNRVGPARNIGIRYSQGDVVLFNDADILMAKDCLGRHSQYHHKDRDIIVRGFRMLLSRKFKPDLTKVKNISSFEKIAKPEKPDDERKIHCRLHNLSEEGWQRVATPNLSIRKEHLEKVGGFSRDFVFWGFEDVDLGYRLKGLGLKLIWDDKIKVYHLHHLRESGSKLNDLIAFKIGANILYNKYLDDEIRVIFTDVIKRRWKKYVNFSH